MKFSHSVALFFIIATVAIGAVDAGLFSSTDNDDKPASFEPHQCEHDKIRHREKVETIDVKYEFHDNEDFLAAHREGGGGGGDAGAASTGQKKPAHQMRQAEALAVNPAGTLGNMRFKSFLDDTTCPGSDCGRCLAQGQSVQTFESGAANVLCTADDVLTAAKQSYIANKLMPGAMKILSALLRINPVSGSLNPGTGYCGSPGAKIPAAHTASGVADTDFIIYVTAAPKTDATSQTVAWALKCREDGSKRPTVAHVNWVPRKLTNAATLDAVKMESDIMTATHEILHALGFSAPFFGGNGYVDFDRVAQPGGTTTLPATAPLNKARTFITSPRVVQEMRSYFGCETAVGAEIEDQGGAGTAGSHWEKRIFQQHVMSGISTTVAVYPSRLLLAYLEDTGHYLPNYALVDTFQHGHITFGRGKGCAFLNERCDSATNKASGEWCFETDSTKARCTFDGLAKGYCGVATGMTGIPTNMRYFDVVTTGSAVQLDDFCPTASYYSNRRCVDLRTTPVSGGGEFYGSNSRCFQSNLKKPTSSITTSSGGGDGTAANEARCLQAYCHEDGTMSVVIDLRLYPCPAAGGKATLTGIKGGYTGDVICPPTLNYCPTNWSDANGDLPGMVPSPEETTATFAPSYAKPVPGACAARVPCAVSKLGLMPACRRFAFEVGRCFGTDCDAEMETWLRNVAGASSNCTGTGRSDFDAYCQEDKTGAKAVCNLAGLSAGALLSGIVLCMLALLLLVL